MTTIQAAILILFAVLVVAVIVTTLLRRRRGRLDPGANAVDVGEIPQLTEADIAYRIGLGERPVDEAAEAAAAEAATAAAAFAAAAAAVRAGEVATPGTAADRGTAPVPADIAAAPTAPVAVLPARERAVAPEPPPSGRLRLWRDSAAVLLVVSIALLGASALFPGFLSAPAPPLEPEPSTVAVVATPTPSPTPDRTVTPVATPRPPPSPSPSPSPSPTPSLAPTASPQPTPRRTPRPERSTPRPTPRPTPRRTPRPTPRATPRPTPKPTPRPTAAPVVARITGASCSGNDRWTFTAKAGTPDWTYVWDLNGTVRSGRTVAWGGWASTGEQVVILTVTGRKGSAQDFTTVQTPCP